MLTNITETHDLVRVSGRGALVNFEIDDQVPLNDACRALREHLGRNRHLYSGGEVIADIGVRLLSDSDQGRIRKVIESESGLSVKQFWCRPEILVRESLRIARLMAEQADIAGPRSLGDEPGVNMPVVTDDADAGHEVHSPSVAEESLQPEPLLGETEGPDRVPTEIARGNLRAGETRVFPGHAVILGNVNPGAQVIADGDIIVFGGLRGRAHAGASGDITATIIATSIAYPVLRIADYSWHRDGPTNAFGRHSNDGNGPTLARVSNGAIHVAPYLNIDSIHQGGNPNER
jgi:septum site-determining protein MinC